MGRSIAARKQTSHNLKMDMIERENEREWRKLILSQMGDLKSEIKELRSENKIILETMTTLKVKIGIAGSFFGLIGGLILELFKK